MDIGKYLFILGVLFLCFCHAYGQHQDTIHIWYGNPNGKPISAKIGDTLTIDTYIQSPERTMIYGFQIRYQFQDDYIVDYYGGQDYWGLLAPRWSITILHSPPNPAGWSSIYVYWQHQMQYHFNFANPYKIFSLKYGVVNDSSLARDTVNCLDLTGGTQIWDTAGTYYIVENVSPIYFCFMEPETCNYLPGDFNGDNIRSGGDVTFGVRYFKGLVILPSERCVNDSTGEFIYSAGDVNNDCQFRGSDITRLVAYFKDISAINPCRWTPPRNW